MVEVAGATDIVELQLEGLSDEKDRLMDRSKENCVNIIEGMLARRYFSTNALVVE
jgi:hypothetical protein